MSDDVERWRLQELPVDWARDHGQHRAAPARGCCIGCIVALAFWGSALLLLT